MAQLLGIKIKWDESAGPAANAGRELPRLVSAYFSTVRAFLAEDPTPPELHQLRLASKRLRYTLELFRPCYPAGLEDRIRALKKLQDWLGEVNDAVASGRLLRGALKNRPERAQVPRRPRRAAGGRIHPPVERDLRCARPRSMVDGFPGEAGDTNKKYSQAEQSKALLTIQSRYPTPTRAPPYAMLKVKVGRTPGPRGSPWTRQAGQACPASTLPNSFAANKVVFHGGTNMSRVLSCQ